jgi:hypothetical protein
MKPLILLVCAVIPVAGCASNKGGTAEEPPQYGPQSSVGEANPEPMSSPTFRPGLNPEDPRDSQFMTRPQPNQAPPQTP